MYHTSIVGKACPSSKPKKSKNKTGDPGEGSSGSRNPKIASQSGNELEDDGIGQEIVKPDSVSAKFCSNACSQIRNMIKTDWLLPNEMLDLRGDLEKLILYSASKATWAKHCSAWKLYDKFCQIYNIRFELPIRVHHIF